jgi:hypothetical protein
MPSREYLKRRLSEILDPEPDEDGLMPIDYPHPRLRDQFGLDTNYANKSFLDSEGSSIHQDTRLMNPDEPGMPRGLFKNLDLAHQLFDAALHVFGDSLIAYAESEEVSIFRYYPPAIITFWSGFEAHVRFLSELLVITVNNIPEQVKAQLLEYEMVVSDKGDVVRRDKSYPVLTRYQTLLRYGYGYQVDRGSQFWQQGDSARKLRNYLVHIDVTESLRITAQDVLDFMENVLLMLIAPSCAIGKSILLHQFLIHTMVTDLRDLIYPHTEQPFFHERTFSGKFFLHCNFDGVDTNRFPNSEQFNLQRRKNR